MEPQSSSMAGLDKGLNSMLAMALDQAIEAHLAGRVQLRDQLLAQHPELAAALQAFGPGDRAGSQNTGPCEPASADTTQQQIGPYRIVRELGSGSFGSVYLASDLDLRRQVALKVLHTGRLGQAGILERFQREACATARLRHPGIIQLYDYSREGPPHYLVTEFVEGVELREWQKSRRLTPHEAADLVA